MYSILILLIAITVSFPEPVSIFSSDSILNQILPLDSNGVFNGEYKKYYRNGALKKVISYSNGYRNGTIKKFLENGGLEYQGDIKDGSYHGWFILYYENGSPKDSTYYLFSTKNGRSITYDSLGSKISETNFCNGLLHGEVRFYYKNGNVEFQSHYQNGIPNGERIVFSESGELKTGLHELTRRDGSYFKVNVNNGKVEGDFVAKLPDTYVLDGKFKNGLPEGKWIYRNNGVVDRIQYFESGIFLAQDDLSDKPHKIKRRKICWKCCLMYVIGLGLGTFIGAQYF